MKNKKIILLVGAGISSNILYNSLVNDFNIVTVIQEKPISRIRLFSNRIRKVGVVTVLGQIFFVVLLVPLIRIRSFRRRAEIFSLYGLNTQSFIGKKGIINISSVNSEECIDAIKKNAPDLVIINGTRIISRAVLQSVSCPFVNIHAGITPYYRGVHGGYWALANKDPEHCGVTVHLVDTGIDTGNILSQAKIAPNYQDNFTTYPLLQLASGIEQLKLEIPKLLANKEHRIRISEKGTLWHHPTIWYYCRTFLKTGIK